ncbi:MAG: hypothetical protein J1E84_02680 [Muribaculaceae bacterium]|nr:hypothetical protein [Muribaculaceae bacterium]
MRKYLFLVVSILTVALCFNIEGQNTRRRGLKVKDEHRPVERVTGVEELDTISPRDGDIVLNGYDKPLHTRYETVFVTNNLHSELQSIKLNIQYRDLAGRQLHQTEQWVNCTVPPGQTRMITFNSWDKQQSFYYRHSRLPARSKGTAYDIFVSIPAAVVKNQE